MKHGYSKSVVQFKSDHPRTGHTDMLLWRWRCTDDFDVRIWYKYSKKDTRISKIELSRSSLLNVKARARQIDRQADRRDWTYYHTAVARDNNVLLEAIIVWSVWPDSESSQPAMIFTAPRYASAVWAVSVCLSVRLSVSHKSAFYGSH